MGGGSLASAAASIAPVRPGPHDEGWLESGLFMGADESFEVCARAGATRINMNIRIGFIVPSIFLPDGKSVKLHIKQAIRDYSAAILRR